MAEDELQGKAYCGGTGWIDTKWYDIRGRIEGRSSALCPGCPECEVDDDEHDDDRERER